MFDKIVLGIAWVVIGIPIAYCVLLCVLYALGNPKGVVKALGWIIGFVVLVNGLAAQDLGCSGGDYDCPNTYYPTC